MRWLNTSIRVTNGFQTKDTVKFLCGNNFSNHDLCEAFFQPCMWMFRVYCIWE
ncbi:hypothetical protein HanPI659440_Chr03g0123771 [Helianthus annuus]|nr:hypothetical protein HanPI659440_Chr03g0123771 [Helianthus annuus]